MADNGSAVLQQRTALGDAPGGNAVRLPYNVSGGHAVLQLRTVSGVADAQRVADAELTLENRTAVGVASQGTASIGAVSLEKRTAFGAAPNTPVLIREKISATGIALNGSVATGTADRKRLEALGFPFETGFGTGTARLQTRSATGVGTQQSLVTVNNILLRRQAQGVSISGSVATGTVTLPRRSIDGLIAELSVSQGAITLPFKRVTGFGEESLAVTFRTWVMNTANEVLTEYTNQPFNSYAEFNGKHYAAGPDGIFELTGTKDVTTNIDWTIRTGFMDDKIINQKRLHELLMGIKFNGPIRIRVWVDNESFYEYTLTNFREDTLHQVRAKLGKGLKSRYFRIELAGANGSTVEIDSMSIPFIPVARRAG